MFLNAQVLVIGGGPVGLSAAICLGRQGIPTLLVEKNKEVTDHPKARGVNARSMELFRQWGLEENIRVHSFPQNSARFTWMTDFQEDIITHVKADNSIFNEISPTNRCLISQEKIEEVLWAKVLEDPCITVLRSKQAYVLNQDDNYVYVEISDPESDEYEHIVVQYVIAADGAHSSVRKKLAIPMDGGKLGEHCSVYSRMDLKAWLKDGPSVGFFRFQNEVEGKY